ncbi:hypothetical protein [Mycolicibacterium sp.]|uniref:hypothetical protein n=1 Tax=Mycolicibacterium sp. TaxID=2320850 RepID=UPI0037CBADBC
MQDAIATFFGAVNAGDLASACEILDLALPADYGEYDCVRDLDWPRLGYGTVQDLGNVTVDSSMIDFETPTETTDSDGNTYPVPEEYLDRFAWVYEDALSWPGMERPEYDILLLLREGDAWRIVSVGNGGSFEDGDRRVLQGD